MGVVKYVFEFVLVYIKECKQFKIVIVEFNVLKEKIVKMVVCIFVFEFIQYCIFGLLEEVFGGLYECENYKLVVKQLVEFVMECLVCKVYGLEIFDLIVDELLQFYGGVGFI